ncbi:glycoside hydrolase superfamily [Ilyonectria destructans]|nr:glycoside hydrolase superfamily [Ilyonectria destructans]
MGPLLDFQSAVSQVQAGGDVFRLSQALLEQLSKEEKLALLHGNPTFWKGMSELFTNSYATKPYLHSHIKRLGIPGIRYCDGPRGVNINQATAFPCPMARGATWDPRLEEKVGRAIGLEARVSGANCVGSICINLPRHPAWGRVQETYGEDPLLLGQFGVAHIAGLQRNVMACVKHFALNSMETARFRVNVSVDNAALHEVFLPHFKRCVDAGALSIMTAYNAVNGEWAGESHQLIQDILRSWWKYDGIIITDWLFGLRDGVKSVKAGLDIEAPFQNRRLASLEKALSSGELSWPEIETVAARVIRNQLRFYATRQAEEPAGNVVFSKAHRDVAGEVATRSIVLLKNDKIDGKHLLPLPSDLVSCAIIGRHANSALTGDRASSWVDCPEVVTPYQGIKERFPNTAIHLSASDSEEDAIFVAKKSDVAILIVGYDGNDEGEFLKPSPQCDPGAFALFPEPDDSPEARLVQDIKAKAQAVAEASDASAASRPDDDFLTRPAGGDRTSVRLRPQDVRLIRAVTAVNPRTVVSIITAGAVITEDWNELVPSLLVSWYNGCEGGHALGKILAGMSNPSGRLPWSMPRTEAHLPPFNRDANGVTYDKWFGQRMLDKMGVQATYPLGYGLSYTQFEIEAAELSMDRAKDKRIHARVRNTGDRDGWCVVQVYACPDFGPGPHDFPNRLLVGFRADEVKAGADKAFDVPVSLEPVRRWRGDGLVFDARSITFEVGQYAGDSRSMLRVLKVSHEVRSLL